jgi:hypothetical protein
LKGGAIRGIELFEYMITPPKHGGECIGLAITGQNMPEFNIYDLLAKCGSIIEGASDRDFATSHTAACSGSVIYEE